MEIDTVVVGDCLDVMADMPDESVDLIMTDPDYTDIEMYAAIAPEFRRLLKPNKAALIFCSIGSIDITLDALRPALSYRWTCVWYQSNNMKRADTGYCKWACMLWMERGRSKPYRPLQDLRNVPILHAASRHKWAKGQKFVDYYVEGFTKPGQVVFDPFMGSGTTAAAAVKAGCHFYGCDIDQRCIDTISRTLGGVQLSLPGCDADAKRREISKEEQLSL